MWVQVVTAAAIAIPLGLDLYMPVPDENPMATARIELRKWTYGEGGDPDAFLPSGGGAWTWY